MTRRLIKSTILVLAITVLIAGSVSAQYHWLRNTDVNTVILDIQKPKLNDVEGVGFASSVWFLGGNIRLSNKISLAVEAPISHFSRDHNDRSDSQTLFGNPYLGLEFHAMNQNNTGEFITRLGVRLPLVSDNNLGAAEYGLITDILHYDAFYPKTFSFLGGFGYNYFMKNDLFVKVNIDGIFLFPTDNNNRDNELFVDYNFTFGHDSEKFALYGGLAGMFIATLEDADFGEKTMHFFGAGGRYKFDKIQPGFVFKYMIDDELRDVLDFTFGITLSYIIG